MGKIDYMKPELIELSLAPTEGQVSPSVGCRLGYDNDYICAEGGIARGAGCTRGEAARDTCSAGPNVGRMCYFGNHRSNTRCMSGSTLTCRQGAAGSVSCGAGNNPSG